MPVFRCIAPLLLLLLLSAGCRHRVPVTVTRGFYYWKSNSYSVEKQEQEALNTLKVVKLYLKFFEVDRDTLLGIVPAAKTNFHQYDRSYLPDSNYTEPRIIPTVFIKNEALKGVSAAGVDSLAGNIIFLIEKYRKNMSPAQGDISELQIDCDWTTATRDAYFSLLRHLKKLSGKAISCTLRLYPYKYREKMGVPPVDRATLMCYNLINPLSNEHENSILSLAELKAYLGRKSDYPLPLDIALPLFSWYQLYQNDRFVKVFYSAEQDMAGILRPVKPLWFEVRQDTVIGDTYLRAGDRMKYEQVSTEVLQQVAETLKERIALSDSTTIVFFHLDKKLLTEYTNETLDSLYNSFGH